MAEQLAGGASSGGGESAADFVAGGAPWSGRDMLLGGAVVFVAAVLSAALAVGADARGMPQALAVSLAALTTGGAMLGAVHLAGLRKYRLSWRAVGWRMPARARHWLLAPAALAASMAFAAVYALTAQALGAGFLVPEELPAGVMGDGWTALASAFAVVVWTPLAEETFYRGFLFAGLGAKLGLGAGVIASAAIFALSHASVGSFIPIMFAGALFAWIYRKSGSLWPAVLAHAGQNMLAFLAIAFA